MRRDSMRDVINASINQTLGRTVITAGTALLTSLALLFFGGEVLHGFAFTMVVGIITGTYSSVFIAAATVSFWRGSAPTRAAAHAPAESKPVAAAPQQPTRKAKPQKTQRKARAS
jgi:preprotein translocase subunit SecF